MKRWYRLMSIVMTAVLAAGSIQVPAFASQAAPDIIIEKIEEDVTAGETVQEAASEAMEMPEDESVLYDSAEIDENAMEDMPEAASYGDTEQEDVEDTEYAVTVHEETAGYEGPATDESGAEEPEKENVGTTENAESDWLETEGTENAGETEDSDTSVTEDPAEGYYNEGSGAEEDDAVEDAGVDETVQENDDTDGAGYEEDAAGKEAEEEGFRAEIPEPEAGEKDIPDAETITDDPEAGSVTDIANGSVYDADRTLEDSTAIDEESAPGTASAGKEETESSYTVTFHANGGYFISEDGVKEEAVSATAPVGEGILLVSSSEIRNDDPHMVFKGWKETEDSGCIEASPDGLYYSDSDRDVYAAWEREAVYVASITLRENEMTLAVNKEKALKVKEILPEDADNKGLRWTSSNTKAATVTQKGVVKGVGKGTATITAAARDGSGVKASCKVTVKQPVTKVTLNKKTASMMRGKALTLKASVSPKNANNRDIRWTSSNTKVATVTQKGVVKGVGKGTATITAAARDGSRVKASCRITVRQPVAKVILDKNTISIVSGKTSALKASVFPENADSKTIVWTSSDTKVVTVTQQGIVKGIRKGNATITAKAADGSGVKAACQIAVTQPASKGLKEIDSVIFAFDPLEIIRENPITNFVSIILTDTDSTGLDERTGPKTPKAPEAPKKPAAPKSPRPAEEPKAPEPPKKPAVPKTPKPAEEPKAPKTPETVEKPFVPQIPETVEEQPPHTHTWKNMVKTVHHDATGHYEKKQTGTRTVVDEEEWDEAVYKSKGFCTECDFSSFEPLENDLHNVFAHNSDASYFIRLVQTGTVHHPAVTHEEPVYEKVWVEDKAAWDETIITGQKCIECGATK